MLEKEEVEELKTLVEDRLELLHENHVDDNFDESYEKDLKTLHSLQKKLRQIK